MSIFAFLFSLALFVPAYVKGVYGYSNLGDIVLCVVISFGASGKRLFMIQTTCGFQSLTPGFQADYNPLPQRCCQANPTRLISLPTRVCTLLLTINFHERSASLGQPR